MTAGILALLSFSSCELMYGDSNAASCDANLTCIYGEGIPTDSERETYDLDGPLRDSDIEDIFMELCGRVKPGFTSAVLEINFFDWSGDYISTRVYDFVWVPGGGSGDGSYTWSKRLE